MAYQHRHWPDLSFALLDLLLVTEVVMGGAEGKTSQSCDCSCIVIVGLGVTKHFDHTHLRH